MSLSDVPCVLKIWATIRYGDMIYEYLWKLKGSLISYNDFKKSFKEIYEALFKMILGLWCSLNPVKHTNKYLTVKLRFGFFSTTWSVPKKLITPTKLTVNQLIHKKQGASCHTRHLIHRLGTICAPVCATQRKRDRLKRRSSYPGDG